MAQGRNMAQGGVKALTPSGFKINRIEIQRHDGEVKANRDIAPLITDFEITESLYSSTIIARFDVKDGANLVEEFPLIGQEKLIVEIEREEHETGIVKEIFLNMVITEYPLFNRPEDIPNLSVYKFVAVSEHAYTAGFLKLSRAFNKNFRDEIKQIFIEDLKFDKDKIIEGTKVATKANGIIPNLPPLNAIEYFRARSCDSDGAPLFVYQTLDGSLHLKTLTDLITGDLYGIYRDSKHFKTEAFTLADYKERQSKLVDITSRLGFGRVFQAQRGAFASRLDTVDLSTKTFTTNPYTYDIEDKTLNKRKPYSTSFTINDIGIEKYYDSHNDYVSVNSKAYGDSVFNANHLRVKHEQKQRAYLEGFETMTHDIELYGDFSLNPGKRIEIRIPKAVDPESQSKTTNSDKEEVLDLLLSGYYIVTGVQHKFKNDEYFLTAKIKRDSFELGFA